MKSASFHEKQDAKELDDMIKELDLFNSNNEQEPEEKDELIVKSEIELQENKENKPNSNPDRNAPKNYIESQYIYFDYQKINIKNGGSEINPLSFGENSTIQTSLHPFYLDIKFMLVINKYEHETNKENKESDSNYGYKKILDDLKNLVLHYRETTGFSKLKDLNYFIDNARAVTRRPYYSCSPPLKKAIEKINKDLQDFKKVIQEFDIGSLLNKTLTNLRKAKKVNELIVEFLNKIVQLPDDRSVGDNTNANQIKPFHKIEKNDPNKKQDLYYEKEKINKLFHFYFSNTESGSSFNDEKLIKEIFPKSNKNPVESQEYFKTFYSHFAQNIFPKDKNKNLKGNELNSNEKEPGSNSNEKDLSPNEKISFSEIKNHINLRNRNLKLMREFFSLVYFGFNELKGFMEMDTTKQYIDRIQKIINGIKFLDDNSLLTEFDNELHTITEKFTNFYLKYDPRSVIKNIKKSTKSELKKNSNPYKIFRQQLNTYQGVYFHSYCKKIKSRLDKINKRFLLESPSDPHLNFGKFCRFFSKSLNTSEVLDWPRESEKIPFGFIYLSSLNKLVKVEKFHEQAVYFEDNNENPEQLIKILEDSENNSFKNLNVNLKANSEITYLTSTESGDIIVLANQKFQLIFIFNESSTAKHKKIIFPGNRLTYKIYIFENQDVKTQQNYVYVLEAGMDSNIQIFKILRNSNLHENIVSSTISISNCSKEMDYIDNIIWDIEQHTLAAVMGSYTIIILFDFFEYNQEKAPEQKKICYTHANYIKSIEFCGTNILLMDVESLSIIDIKEKELKAKQLFSTKSPCQYMKLFPETKSALVVTLNILKSRKSQNFKYKFQFNNICIDKTNNIPNVEQIIKKDSQSKPEENQDYLQKETEEDDTLSEGYEDFDDSAENNNDGKDSSSYEIELKSGTNVNTKFDLLKKNGDGNSYFLLIYGEETFLRVLEISRKQSSEPSSENDMKIVSLKKSISKKMSLIYTDEHKDIALSEEFILEKKCRDVAFSRGNSIYLYDENFKINMYDEKSEICSNYFSYNYDSDKNIGLTNLKSKVDYFLEKLFVFEKGKYGFYNYKYPSLSYLGIGHLPDCISRNSKCYLISKIFYDHYQKLLSLHDTLWINLVEQSSKKTEDSYMIGIKYYIESNDLDYLTWYIVSLRFYSVNIEAIYMEFLTPFSKKFRHIYSQLLNFANRIKTNKRCMERLILKINELQDLNKNYQNENEDVILQEVIILRKLLSIFSENFEQTLNKAKETWKVDIGKWEEPKRMNSEEKINSEGKNKSLESVSDLLLLAQNFLNYEMDSYPRVYLDRENAAIITKHLSLITFSFEIKDSKIQIKNEKIRAFNNEKLETSSNRIAMGLNGDSLFFISSDWKTDSTYFIEYFDKSLENKAGSPFPTWEEHFNSKISAFAFNDNKIVLGLINHQLMIINIKGLYKSEESKNSDDNSIQPKNNPEGMRSLLIFPHCSQITCVAISADSAYIASGSDDESLKIFHSSTGMLKLPIKYKSGIVVALEFHPSKPFILASFVMDPGENKPYIYKIHMFSLNDSECIINIGMKVSVGVLRATYPIRPFSRLSFLTDEKILVNTLEDFPKSIDGFSVNSPKIIEQFGGVYTVCHDKSENICVFGGSSSRLEIYPSGKLKTENFLRKSDDKVYCVDIISVKEKTEIAVGFESGQLHLYRLESENDDHKLQKYYWKAFEDSIFCISFSIDGIILLAGMRNGKVIALNFQDSEKVSVYLCKLHSEINGTIADLQISKEVGNNIYEFLTGSYDSTVRLSSLKIKANKTLSIKEKKAYSGNHKRSVFTVAWSNDSKKFLSGGEDKRIFVYERSSFSIIKCIRNHSGSVWNAEFFSDDARQILSSGEDKALILSDTYSGTVLHKIQIKKGSDVWDFSYIPEEDKLIAANDYGLFEFSPFYNTNERVIRMRNILDQKSVPIKFPDDICIFPHSLKMTRLQYAIGMNDIKYIDDVYLYFKNSQYTSESDLRLIFSLLYNEDINKLDAWDYSENYAAQNRDRIRRKLINLHLLMSPNQRRFIHTVRNNLKIIKITKKYFPDKLLKVFESFFSPPFYMNINKEVTSGKNNETMVFLSHPIVNSECINRELLQLGAHSGLDLEIEAKNSNNIDNLTDAKGKKKKNSNKELNPDSIDKIVTTFQVAFEDFEQLFNILNGLELEAEIFSSEKLSIILNFYWEKKFIFWFRISFFFYVGFLISVCYLVLDSFVTRLEENKEVCNIKAHDLNTIILQGIILCVLFIFFLRELFQVLYSERDYFYQKIFYHFSSLWNMLDLLMIGFGFISCVYDYMGGPGSLCDPGENWSPQKYLYSIFLFLSWVRLLDFARGVKLLSSLIRLLVKVTRDMAGFLLVLFYLIIGICFTSYVVQISYSEHSIWEFLRIFYFTLLGNYDGYLNLEPKTHLSDNFSLLIIILISLFMVILMLNMLIALISESHGEVMAIEKQAELFEKLDIMQSFIFIRVYGTFKKKILALGQSLKSLFKRDPKTSAKVNTEGTASTESNQNTQKNNSELAKKYLSFIIFEESAKELELKQNRKRKLLDFKLMEFMKNK